MHKLWINIAAAYANMWRMVYVYQQWIGSSVAMSRIDRMYILSDIFIFLTRVYAVRYLE
jgi:hypothetical protein